MKRVMVVDDEPMLREVVGTMLADEGYAVTLAPDAATALRLLATEHPDLVLMDVMMPGMDGVAAYRALRARSDLAQPRVVLMSASVGLRGIDPEAAGYLAKPFDIDELIGLVHRLIGPGERP